MANTYKHSGTIGDLIYCLPLVKHFGGGKFYLHLNQINWIGAHYYKAPPNPAHQGRMNQQDYENLKGLLEAQDYITSFEVLDPATTEITHNMDRFRPLFVGHPGNYVDCYAEAFNVFDKGVREGLRNTPWLTVPTPRTVEGRTIAVSRTERWLPPSISPIWQDWQQQGLEDKSFFVGTPAEYAKFQQDIGWNIPHQLTNNLLELAEYLAGAEIFIGNQSGILSLAIGLGLEYWCEARRDLPIQRNECYFPLRPNGNYF